MESIIVETVNDRDRRIQNEKQTKNEIAHKPHLPAAL